MVSEENLAFLRARDGQHIVGTPKAMLGQFEEDLTQMDWHEVQEVVEVKLVRWTKWSSMRVESFLGMADLLVLCNSSTGGQSANRPNRHAHLSQIAHRGAIALSRSRTPLA
jgi:hypothetical protein